jgi:hypothetical protein
MSSARVENRGFFRRTWDWLLGRKPPTPAPAPPVPAAAPGAAVAATPSGTASAPANVVVPVPSGIARPVAAPAGAPQQDQDARPPSASGVPGVAAAVGGAAGGVALEAALQRSFGRREATAGQSDPGQGPSARSRVDGPTRKPNGYILHLTNGRSIPVAMYEERGDQVLVTQAQGTYGLPKTLIARIEPRIVETDVATARGR